MRKLRVWDAAIIGIVCFFAGAALMLAFVKHVFHEPLRIGNWQLRYFSQQDITHAFHKQYIDEWWDQTVMNTWWLGTQTMQTPLDMWVTQEILHETRPDVLVETGTRLGGGAFYYASIMDLLRHGRILTVDIDNHPGKPDHPRIEYFTGSSTDPAIVGAMQAKAQGERVMVILDSDHSKEHVLQEMDMYGPLVCVGCYMVVQDTHLNGYPVHVAFSPGPGKQGPMEAVHEFLARNSDFVVDRDREKYGLTFNPNGWLKRVR
ncbi:MAG: cephalosporin hydroxylase [Bryobacterales bacterium]|jgi:cephalosporin hydroxylase|nr:cephalosporin hydroxylase [Bryobacterales bacterium]